MESSVDGGVEIYYLADMPGGVQWAWFGTELLVIEGRLDECGRERAIDEAFADARARALGSRPGRPLAA